MKIKLTTFILFLFVQITFGQINRADIEKMTPEEQEAYYEKIGTSYKKTKSATSLSSIWKKIPLSTNGCLNGSFEQNYNGWTGVKLCRIPTTPSTGILPIENGITLNQVPPCNSTGITPLPLNSLSNGKQQIKIVTQGNDSWLASANPSVTLSKIPVNGGSKAMLLGNKAQGYAAEMIAKKFVITNANKKFYFKYATVMDRSHSHGDGSANGTEVFFVAKAIDVQTGQTIAKYTDIGNPGNPNIKSTNSYGKRIYYRNWNCKMLDLSLHVGKTVVVYFLNSDCSRSGHKGYTYIDDVCKPCKDNEGEVKFSLKFDGKNCIKFPEPITGNYTVPVNATQKKLEFVIYKNNVAVKTIQGPPVIGTSGTFNLNLTQSHFAGLNTNVGQGYDIVAVLKFKQPNMNQQLVQVTKYSSTPINNIQNGAYNGVNNDFKFCKNEPDIVIDEAVVVDPIDGITGGTIPFPFPVPPADNDNCCPPWNKKMIIENTKIKQNPNGNGLNSNYTIWFNPTQELKNKMQTYLDYAHSMNPSINSIIINWQLRESDKDCKKFGTQVTNEAFTYWTASGNGNITGGNFWNGYPLEVGKHYLLHTGIYLDNEKDFFDKECAVNQVCIYINVTSKGQHILELTINGKTYKKELSTAKKEKIKKRF